MAARKKARKGATRKAARPTKARKSVRKAGKPAKSAAQKPAPAAAHNPWKAYADALQREAAVTARVMRSFPADQPTFQPHPRSSNAMRLFWTFAMEQLMALDAVKGTLKMPPSYPPPPATLAECITVFERNVADLVRAARAARPEHHSRMVQFFTGPGQMADVPAGPLAEMMLADQIHHRGQLSVYVRMAGGKVPSIYGPSADEPW